MATTESLKRATEEEKKREIEFQKIKKDFLEKFPFPADDYEKQKIAYENLVEVHLRMQEAMSKFSSFAMRHMPLG